MRTSFPDHRFDPLWALLPLADRIGHDPTTIGKDFLSLATVPWRSATTRRLNTLGSHPAQVATFILMY